MKRHSLLAPVVVGAVFGFGAVIVFSFLTIHMDRNAKPALAQKSAPPKLSANEVVKLFRNGDVYARILLTGTTRAYNWANTSLQAEGKTALFCVPDVVLTVDQEVDLMARYIERYPQSGENPAGAAMLQALKEAFPCKPVIAQ